MHTIHLANPSVCGLLIALLVGCAAPAAAVANAARIDEAKATADKAKARRASKRAVPAALVIAAASDEQVSAAAQVYYGTYQCEFKHMIQVAPNAQYAAYVDLSFGKSIYLMKPVLSPIGAIRLEDVKGQTLMIQIADKSMLMNVKTGIRLVDECINPRQRAATANANAASNFSNTNGAAAQLPE